MNFRLSYILVLPMVLIGCASVSTEKDSLSSEARSSSNLITPPGLSTFTSNSNYKLTDSNEGPTYTVNNNNDVQIVMAGSQIWLKIKNKNVDQLWPTMTSFLTQQGLNIKINNQKIGLLETEWAERDNTVSETGVRAFFDWIGFGSQYSLKSQYLYRINLWQDQDSTLIFVTDYEMNQVYPGCKNPDSGSIRVHPSDYQATKWVPVAPNPQIQLSFLEQFMVFSGINKNQAKKITADVVKNIDSQNGRLNGNNLIINDYFDRAWWRTGVALERSGLGVSDKNRSLGEYYVYILQSDVDNSEPGFLSKLFNNNNSKLELPKPKYIVKLTSDNNITTITLKLYPGAEDKNFSVNQQKYLLNLQKEFK